MKNQKLIIFSFFILLTVGLNDAWAACPDIRTQITFPPNNSNFYAPTTPSIPIDVNAFDNCRQITIHRVKYLVDGVVKADKYSGSPSQFTYSWSNPSLGSHTITVQAYDINGNNSSASVNVTLTPPIPSVTLSVPSSSFFTPNDIVLTASASIPAGSLTKVEFYNGTTLLGTDFTSPYSYTWRNVSIGSYNLSAKVYGSYNGSTQTNVTSALTISVYNPPSFIAFDNQCRVKLTNQ